MYRPLGFIACLILVPSPCLGLGGLPLMAAIIALKAARLPGNGSLSDPAPRTLLPRLTLVHLPPPYC